MIYMDLCKKLKFDHTNKWSMLNSETVIEKETHRIISDFEIQTDDQTMWLSDNQTWWLSDD